jgi:capsular polysaccharide biosynthesis protein
MEIQGFIPLLRRWWWLLLIGGVVAGIVAYAVGSRIDPTYEAEVGLVTGPINADEGTVRASGALARTYSELAVSGPLLERTASRLGLSTPTEDLREAVRSSSNEVSRIVTIRVQDSVPARTALFAETLANELIQLSEEVASESTEAVDELMRQDEIGQLNNRQQAQIRTAAVRVFGSPLAGQLSIVDPPEIPTEQVAPQVVLITALAFLAGLIGAGLLALFRESLRSPEDPTGEPVHDPIEVVPTGAIVPEPIPTRPVVESLQSRESGDRA